MLVYSRKGLLCAAGNFSIDPMAAVEHAVVTHAHSDHARRGSKRYYTARCGIELLRERVGKNADITGFEFGEKFVLGGVQLSFHSAGHILGSAQVRLQRVTTGSREPFGEVWVASGDYKRDPDPTCHPFEVVPCDVFVTEATFGTPAYQWKKGADLGRQISNWWEENRRRGVNSVLFAYSLGKAQRVLGVLEPFAKRPVYCHGAVSAMNVWYREQGVRLAPTLCLNDIEPGEALSGELFLVPQAFLSSPKASLIGDRFQTAFASGWMSNSGGFGRGNYDTGFVMSDHADWNDLVKTVVESGAGRVYVQHRGNGALVKHLRTLGIAAFPDSALEIEAANQLSMF